MSIPLSTRTSRRKAGPLRPPSEDRGIRIELGETEARLTECDGINEVNVTIYENDQRNKRLISCHIAGINIMIETIFRANPSNFSETNSVICL